MIAIPERSCRRLGATRMLPLSAAGFPQCKMHSLALRDISAERVHVRLVGYCDVPRSRRSRGMVYFDCPALSPKRDSYAYGTQEIAS
jgi:hypothetical protein